MDRLSVDRIRLATFPIARRGYNTRAVHRFLDRVADWLEVGAGDPARAELLRREIAQVGRRTAAILLEADAEARRLLADAEREAEQIVSQAREEAELIRGGTDPPAAAGRRGQALRRPAARGAASPPRPR